MEFLAKKRTAFLLAAAFLSIGFCFFYVKYVPLVKGFQSALLPILFVILFLTVYSLERGLLLFVFLFPLVNNLPYFFGIDESIPHAPTALVLFMAFFMGWLIRRAVLPRPDGGFRLFMRPLPFLVLAIVVSALITICRYANFFPLGAHHVRELIVNVNGVRAGGAMMSVLFAALNELAAILFFAIAVQALITERLRKKALIVLSVSVFISLLFSLGQILYSIRLGNTAFWAGLNQVNSTFKDPNAFGVFLAAVFPVFLAIFLSRRGAWRAVAGLGGMILLFVFPFTGSRSGFLGLLCACLVFLVLMFTRAKFPAPKKKFLFPAFAAVMIVALLVPLFFSGRVNLYKRFEGNIRALTRPDVNRADLDRVLTYKPMLWGAALRQASSHPLTGLGPGAFIIELPNDLRRHDLPHRNTDSAENYFLQVLAELGLIGLLLIAWIFWEIGRRAAKGLRKSAGADPDKEIRFGIIAAAAAILVNFFFHSYIGSFEVKFLFWFLVALIFLASQEKGEGLEDDRAGSKFKAALLLFCLLYGVLHFAFPGRSLSIEAFTNEFGVRQDFGLYPMEMDNRGVSFQWTRKSAGVAVPSLGKSLVVPLGIAHPQVGRQPVRVRISLADRFFNPKALIKEVMFEQKGWQDVLLEVPPAERETVHLVIETDRVWQPRKSGISADPRSLAVELSRPWFRYPKDMPGEKIGMIDRLPSSQWRGKYGKSLHSPGTSEIPFSVSQPDIWLRLHLRGQAAHGVGPQLVFKVDEGLVGETLIAEEGWTTVVLKARIARGEHVFSVEFINDFNDKKRKQDRNVFLGDLEIVYPKDSREQSPAEE